MQGETLGSYRVVRELGRGGMGAVYLAEHTMIGKKVAVKVLLQQFSRDAEIVNRFFNEARAATQIRHPGIVEIFDFGYHASGSAFLVMEFLDGESLSTRLVREGGRLPLEWTAEVTRQTASALRAAHEKGIIHRDLKPDNVYLVPDPDMPMGVRLKVLDFGIAKLSGDGEGSMKTRTGAVMGTPAYMSPEQCRGAGRVDARSDVYSLGCMMFEMACGRLPYVGEGPGDIIGAHIFSEVPRPSALAPGIPPGLDALIVRMLAKTPDARPQSMAEVVAQLEALGLVRPSGRFSGQTPMISLPGDARTISSPPASTTLGGAAAEVARAPEAPRTRGWLVPAALAGVVGLALAGWALLRPPSNAQPTVAAPAAVAAAPEPVAAAPAPAPPRARVKLSIDSSPGGAAVYRAADGVRLGATPFVDELEPSGGEAEYLLKLKGHRDARVTMPASRDEKKLVTMEAKSEPPKPKKSAPSKPGKNAVINPF